MPVFDRRHLLGGLAAGLVLPWGRGFAAEAQAAGVLPAVAIAQTTSPPVDPGASIQDKIDALIEKTGLRDQEANGVTILQGIGIVPVNANDPHWVQQRTMAYEEAVLKAQASYIASQQTKIASDAIASVYKAASMDPPPYDEGALGEPGKVAELARKALAVTGGTMDKALEQLGVDPRSLEKAPPAQRHVQFERSLTIAGMERSFGSLTGMVTRFTTEAWDKEGNAQIGVVALVSDRLRDFAQSVLSRRGQFTPDPSKAQDFKAVASDKAALVDWFGVRWMHDQQGLPVIVSFAQWGVERTGTKDAAMLAEFDETALRQAEIRAGGQIAEFLAASGESESNAEYRSRMQEAADRMADGYIAQKDPEKSIEAPLKDAMQRRARVDNLTGLITLTKWKHPHPAFPQQMIYGAVRYWSAAGEAAIRRQIDRAPDEQARPAPVGQAGVRTSKDIGDF